MESSLFDLLLLRGTLASSAAILLVMSLRRPLRKLAGADAAYLCWLTVPLALCAAALPSMKVAPVIMLAAAPAKEAVSAMAYTAPASVAALGWLLPAWACGALATFVLLAAAQLAFRRSLGPLTRQGPVFVASTSQHGPVLLGLWRPAVVVPADFALRYSDSEQALILSHERTHAARRDPVANAMLALLRCAFWFNPLMHLAATRFRFDQELACDAAVMRLHEVQRQDYASAMLKTQTSGAPALSVCHWQSSHPLKERIMHLKHAVRSTSRRRAGQLIVAMLASVSVLATVAVRAETGTAAEGYALSVKFAEGEGNTTPAIPVKAGEDLSLNWSQAGHGWKGVFRVKPASPQTVMVNMNITLENGETIAPSLLLKLNEAGTVAATGKDGSSAIKIGLTVTRS